MEEMKKYYSTRYVTDKDGFRSFSIGKAFMIRPKSKDLLGSDNYDPDQKKTDLPIHITDLFNTKEQIICYPRTPDCFNVYEICDKPLNNRFYPGNIYFKQRKFNSSKTNETLSTVISKMQASKKTSPLSSNSDVSTTDKSIGNLRIPMQIEYTTDKEIFIKEGLKSTRKNLKLSCLEIIPGKRCYGKGIAQKSYCRDFTTFLPPPQRTESMKKAVKT